MAGIEEILNLSNTGEACVAFPRCLQFFGWISLLSYRVYGDFSNLQVYSLVGLISRTHVLKVYEDLVATVQSMETLEACTMLKDLIPKVLALPGSPHLLRDPVRASRRLVRYKPPGQTCPLSPEHCICKVFRPLDFFHIMLRHSLTLKWIKSIFFPHQSTHNSP